VWVCGYLVVFVAEEEKNQVHPRKPLRKGTPSLCCFLRNRLKARSVLVETFSKKAGCLSAEGMRQRCATVDARNICWIRLSSRGWVLGRMLGSVQAFFLDTNDKEFGHLGVACIEGSHM
jgi:hypothetical protein